MALGEMDFAQRATLSLFALAVISAVIWKVVPYVRMRFALLAVSKIPGPPSQSILIGNLKEYFARDGLEFHRRIARDYGSIVKINGFLGEPVLYVSDPKALHTILVKEEHHFKEADDFVGTNQVVFGTCLVSTLGPHHGKQRKALNPVFSVNHMRSMLPLFYEVGQKLREAVKTRVQDGPTELDMLSWCSRTALELMGQGTLGYSFDPLVTDKPDAYGEALKSLGPEIDRAVFLRKVIPASEGLPNWLRRSVVKLFPPGTSVHKLAQIVNTLDQRSREIYADKVRALEKGDTEMVKQVGQGKDIMSILLRANAAADVEDRMSQEEVIAQMSMFIFAGLDTTSNALSRILTVLAEHPEHQQKLREELLHARAAEGLPYDELNRLPYLDGVIRETLRLYSPATILFRIATADTVLPLSKPVYTTDGNVMESIPVPKGSQYLVGFLGCNMSKAMWGEDAPEWKPERWLSPLPSTLTESRVPGVYSNLMTFSGGKRSCIGFKFSEMEMKVVLSMLVSTFTFELTGKPIEWNVGTVTYPTVGKESNKAELPLRVGIYEPAQAAA